METPHVPIAVRTGKEKHAEDLWVARGSGGQVSKERAKANPIVDSL